MTENSFHQIKTKFKRLVQSIPTYWKINQDNDNSNFQIEKNCRTNMNDLDFLDAFVKEKRSSESLFF